MNKEDAHKALTDGQTLFVPTWYFTSCDGERIYATCDHENCCENDFDSFEEFWKWHGDDKRMKIMGL